LASSIKLVFGGTNIEFVNYQCTEGCWGRALDSHNIRFYSPASGHLKPRLVAHEFGHVFNSRVEAGIKNGYPIENVQTPYDALASTWETNSSFPRRKPGLSIEDGYAGPPYGWQQSINDSENEEFADMFLGWTFKHFADNSAGETRSSWMNQSSHMYLWIWAAVYSDWR